MELRGVGGRSDCPRLRPTVSSGARRQARRKAKGIHSAPLVGEDGLTGGGYRPNKQPLAFRLGLADAPEGIIGGARPHGSPRHTFFYGCNNNNMGIRCSQWHIFRYEGGR